MVLDTQESHVVREVAVATKSAQAEGRKSEEGDEPELETVDQLTGLLIYSRASRWDIVRVERSRGIMVVRR